MNAFKRGFKKEKEFTWFNKMDKPRKKKIDDADDILYNDESVDEQTFTKVLQENVEKGSSSSWEDISDGATVSAVESEDRMAEILKSQYGENSSSYGIGFPGAYNFNKRDHYLNQFDKLNKELILNLSDSSRSIPTLNISQEIDSISTRNFRSKETISTSDLRNNLMITIKEDDNLDSVADRKSDVSEQKIIKGKEQCIQLSEKLKRLMFFKETVNETDIKELESLEKRILNDKNLEKSSDFERSTSSECITKDSEKSNEDNLKKPKEKPPFYNFKSSQKEEKKTLIDQYDEEFEDITDEDVDNKEINDSRINNMAGYSTVLNRFTSVESETISKRVTVSADKVCSMQSEDLPSTSTKDFINEPQLDLEQISDEEIYCPPTPLHFKKTPYSVIPPVMNKLSANGAAQKLNDSSPKRRPPFVGVGSDLDFKKSSETKLNPVALDRLTKEDDEAKKDPKSATGNILIEESKIKFNFQQRFETRTQTANITRDKNNNRSKESVPLKTPITAQQPPQQALLPQMPPPPQPLLPQMPEEGNANGVVPDGNITLVKKWSCSIITPITKRFRPRNMTFNDTKIREIELENKKLERRIREAKSKGTGLSYNFVHRSHEASSTINRRNQERKTLNENRMIEKKLTDIKTKTNVNAPWAVTVWI